MTKQRNHYSADFKAKVALAAIRGQQTINEIASLYAVHPNQVMQWKKQAQGQCSMKGACQGKTSPTLPIKSVSSTASHRLTRNPRRHYLSV